MISSSHIYHKFCVLSNLFNIIFIFLITIITHFIIPFYSIGKIDIHIGGIFIDILVGISIMEILRIFLKFVDSQFIFFISLFNFIYWLFIPGGHILNKIAQYKYSPSNDFYYALVIGTCFAFLFLITTLDTLFWLNRISHAQFKKRLYKFKSVILTKENITSQNFYLILIIVSGLSLRSFFKVLRADPIRRQWMINLISPWGKAQIFVISILSIIIIVMKYKYVFINKKRGKKKRKNKDFKENTKENKCKTKENKENNDIKENTKEKNKEKIKELKAKTIKEKNDKSNEKTIKELDDELNEKTFIKK